MTQAVRISLALILLGLTAAVHVSYAASRGASASDEGIANRLYITNWKRGTVVVLTTAGNGPVHTLSAGKGAQQLVVSSDGRRAFVAVDGGIAVLDTVAGRLIARVPLYGGPYSWTLQVSPDGSHLYVLDGSGPDSSKFSMFNTATLSDVGRMSITGIATGPAVHPDGTRVYVVHGRRYSNLDLSVIDLIRRSSTHISTLPLSYEQSARGAVSLATSRDGTRLYVAYGNRHTPGHLLVVDTARHNALATIAVGLLPRGVAVSPDGTRVYVANTGSGNVSVIDAPRLTVVQTVTAEPSPHTLALTADGRRLYVRPGRFDEPAEPRFNQIAVIDTLSGQVTPMPLDFEPNWIATPPPPADPTLVATGRNVPRLFETILGQARIAWLGGLVGALLLSAWAGLRSGGRPYLSPTVWLTGLGWGLLWAVIGFVLGRPLAAYSAAFVTYHTPTDLLRSPGAAFLAGLLTIQIGAAIASLLRTYRTGSTPQPQEGATPGPAAWISWSAGIVVLLAAIAIVAMTDTILAGFLTSPAEQHLDSLAGIGLGLLLGGMAIGAVVALPQWLAVRRRVPSARRWVLASIAGWAIGAIAVTGITVPMAGYVPVVELWLALVWLTVPIVAGAVAGLLQWRMLRPWIHGAGWWVPTSILGWAVAAYAGLVLALRSDMNVLAGAAATAILGSGLTGVVLSSMLRRPGGSAVPPPSIP